MSSLRELKDQNRAAIAKADRIMAATRGRSTTEAEQAELDSAFAEAERTSSAIDDIVDGAVEGRAETGVSADVSRASPGFAAYCKGWSDLVSGGQARPLAGPAAAQAREGDRESMRRQLRSDGLMPRVADH